MTKKLTTAVLLIAIAVSGCGDSLNDRPLSRAQFTARANAICRRAVREVDWRKIDTQRFSPGVAVRLGEIDGRAAAELNRLTPPSSMLFEWRIIVDDLRAMRAVFTRMANVLIVKGASGYPVLPIPAEESERVTESHKARIEECAKY